MKSFAALWYLDSHRARNAIRAIARSPARLLMWAIVGLWLALQLFQRTHMPRQIFFFRGLADPYATGIAGLVLVLFGLTLARPTGFGRIMAFGDPVDALFLSRSAIDERLVVFWLQLRQLVLNSWRVVFSAVFVSVYFSRGNPVGAIAGLAGVFILLDLLLLPTALIGRRTNLLKYIWYTVAGIGTLVFVGAFLLPASIGELGLGRVLMAIWHGDGIALAILYACILAVIAGGFARANDVYPEFYASARRLDTARARGRRGGLFSLPTSSKVTRSGSTMLRGPWVEIWKQLAFVRRGNGMAIVAAGTIIALVLGIAGGVGQQRAGGGFAFILGFTVLPLVLIAQTTRSVSLAGDISKPLWWMGDGSVFAKLAVWTFASSLPAIAFVALATATMFAILSPARILLYVVSVSSAVVVSRAVGMLGYALTPSLIDQRGPGMVIRILIFYAASIVPLVLGVTAAIFGRSADLGVACGSLAFAGEGAVCVALAAARLRGRGLEVALAESS